MGPPRHAVQVCLAGDSTALPTRSLATVALEFKRSGRADPSTRINRNASRRPFTSISCQFQPTRTQLYVVRYDPSNLPAGPGPALRPAHLLRIPGRAHLRPRTTEPDGPG